MQTTKRCLLILMVFIIGNSMDLHAQVLKFEEAKQMLTDYKWSLRRLEQDGQMYNVPEDMRGLVRVFLTNGMTYSFVPSDKESEAEPHKYSITKTHMTFYIYDEQMTFTYRIEDFIGYKLYMDVDNNGDIVTFVFDRAGKNNNITPVPQTTIGNQVWSTSNLTTSVFRNGDAIRQAKTKEEWARLGEQATPAWCYPNFDEKKGQAYGKLYNFYAVKDARGLAPEGWHIPSSKEFVALITYLGGREVAAAKMKSEYYWRADAIGNNSTGLDLVPAGFIFPGGTFREVDGIANIWAKDYTHTDSSGVLFARYYRITGRDGKVYLEMAGEYASGQSVRLVKD